jgi:hypothetical protein
MERRAHSDRVETIPDCGDEEIGKYLSFFVRAADLGFN